MKKNPGFLALTAATLLLLAAAPGSAQLHHVQANGIDLAYDIRGEGPPVLILHGGLLTHASMEPYADGLADDHRVILPDSRGHGASSGGDGPIDYRLMTGDMLAFLDELGIPAAHIIGWSDGGIVGLIMAAEHPERVLSVAAFGANVSKDGLTREVREFLTNWKVGDVSESVVQTYREQSPAPEHWPTFFDSMRRLWLEAPILEPGQLADIRTPVLLVFGDRDSITPEHIRLMQNGIEGAQLFVVPGGSHFVPAEKPELILGVVRSFLSELEGAPTE